MKLARILAVFPILILGVACPSEITDKPAAEVSEVSETAATDTAANPEGVTVPVMKEKSKIEFVGAKVTRDHTGQFRDFDGHVQYVDGKPQHISFEIDLNSVETDTEQLTGHLKTADFFDVATYPKATFVSTSLTEAPAGSADGSTHILEGTLDLHGQQKNVSIPVKAETTPEGTRATSEFTINRHDWGISYRGAADDLIRDNVLIKLDMMFPPPPAA